MRKSIMVLGMHRSGTSLLAEAVCRWGAYAGPKKDLIPANRSNSRGFWEYEPMVSLNNMLLTSLNSDWCLPPGENADALMEARSKEECFKTRASYLVSRMEVGGKAWFWKDPRLCILLPFWKQFVDPVFVVTIRRPSEVALSLYKRNGMPMSAALLLWQHYMLSILRETEDAPARLFVDYDALAGGDEQEFKQLCSFLGANCGECCAAENSEDQLKRMISIATPSLNHNRFEAQEACCRLTREQENLQSILEGMHIDGRATCSPADCELYPGWREYLETWYTLRSLSRLACPA